MIVKNYPQIAHRCTGFDHVIANFDLSSTGGSFLSPWVVPAMKNLVLL